MANEPPTKWQAGDLVVQQEQNKDETFSNILYKVVEVTLGHDDVSISFNVLALKWFGPVTEEEYNGLM